jgi:hypothetical protein
MKPATTISGIVLLLIALGHLVRAVSGWPLTIDGFAVPIWVSAVVTVLFALLGGLTFREQRA